MSDALHFQLVIGIFLIQTTKIFLLQNKPQNQVTQQQENVSVYVPY